MSTRKVNPLINAVNESIRESRDNAHRMQQRAKELEAQRMLIRAKFSAMLKDFNTAKHYVSVSMSGQTPLISITLNKLDSFKDTDLTSLLEFLISKNAEIKEEAWPQFHNKDYHAEVEEARVAIHAYVRSDSPTCRRVQVGTQLKEEPVWELHCS
jgi:DNA-binding protein YbaB